MDNKHKKAEHVGQVLSGEFMKLYDLSQNDLAKAIGVHPSRISAIVNGRRGISVDTDLRLTRIFRLPEGFFLRLQEHFEAILTKQKINTELKKIVPVKKID